GRMDTRRRRRWHERPRWWWWWRWTTEKYHGDGGNPQHHSHAGEDTHPHQLFGWPHVRGFGRRQDGLLPSTLKSPAVVLRRGELSKTIAMRCVTADGPTSYGCESATRPYGSRPGVACQPNR